MQICKNIAAIKNLQQLAAKVFNRETPGQMPEGERQPGNEGVVLFTCIDNPQYYCWKNELRDPAHEAPGAAAIDFYGNIWIAVGGNDYDGAQSWQPYHIQRTYRIYASRTGVAVDTFSPVEAAQILAGMPTSDRPVVIVETSGCADLRRSSARVMTDIETRQNHAGEPEHTVVLRMNDLSDRTFTEAYLKAALRL